MSARDPSSDPGIQVVSGDDGAEVTTGAGVQHQPYDRDALLESTEAHFQANFQPDEPVGVTLDQPLSNQDIAVESSSTATSKQWRTLEVLKKKPWLRLALVVVLILTFGTITAAILAGIFARRRSISW